MSDYILGQTSLGTVVVQDDRVSNGRFDRGEKIVVITPEGCLVEDSAHPDQCLIFERRPERLKEFCLSDATTVSKALGELGIAHLRNGVLLRDVRSFVDHYKRATQAAERCQSRDALAATIDALHVAVTSRITPKETFFLGDVTNRPFTITSRIQAAFSRGAETLLKRARERAAADDPWAALTLVHAAQECAMRHVVTLDMTTTDVSLREAFLHACDSAMKQANERVVTGDLAGLKHWIDNARLNSQKANVTFDEVKAAALVEEAHRYIYRQLMQKAEQDIGRQMPEQIEELIISAKEHAVLGQVTFDHDRAYRIRIDSYVRQIQALLQEADYRSTSKHPEQACKLLGDAMDYLRRAPDDPRLRQWRLPIESLFQELRDDNVICQ